MKDSVTTLYLPEGGWVIEHQSSEVSAPVYWCGTDEWTKDNLKAVRFCRKEDAESAQEFIGFMDDETYNHRVAYHEWG